METCACIRSTEALSMLSVLHRPSVTVQSLRLRCCVAVCSCCVVIGPLFGRCVSLLCRCVSLFGRSMSLFSRSLSLFCRHSADNLSTFCPCNPMFCPWLCQRSPTFYSHSVHALSTLFCNHKLWVLLQKTFYTAIIFVGFHKVNTNIFNNLIIQNIIAILKRLAYTDFIRVVN